MKTGLALVVVLCVAGVAFPRLEAKEDLPSLKQLESGLTIDGAEGAIRGAGRKTLYFYYPTPEVEVSSGSTSDGHGDNVDAGSYSGTNVGATTYYASGSTRTGASVSADDGWVSTSSGSSGSASGR